jgi:UPF0755 protein
MKKKWIYITSIFLICCILTATFGLKYYNYIFKSIIQTKNNGIEIIYIPTGSNYSQVKDSLKKFLENEKAIDWLAEKKNYKNKIVPGRYELKNKMSGNELINMLRSGAQKPVSVTFNNIRKLPELAGILAKSLEDDSILFSNYLTNPSTYELFNFNKYSFPVMFIPDTYEFYWNTTPEEFTKRMEKEYNKYWDTNKLNKAKKINLTPIQVCSLASIVEKETIHNDEKPRVAGVYINRVKRKIPLQADPTLVFALDDFTIRRVLNKHKKIDSPYNTYRYNGIPPGPICLPEKSSIESVLNYEKHNYIFFCAKPDYSGYHNFSVTHKQHQQYARKYWKFLNREKIYR